MRTQPKGIMMDETEKKVTFAFLLGAGLVIGANAWYQIRKGKKERALFEATQAKNMRVIQIAKDRVMTRLMDPDEPVPSLDAVLTDFRFQEIIANEELRD
jgi:hypothetical protein